MEFESHKHEDIYTGGVAENRRTHPRITATSTRKKRRVTVVGDSFLKGKEGLIYMADPPHRELCCLPGAWVREITRKLPSTVQSLDYYPQNHRITEW